MNAKPLRIALKYCGSCNPLIDLITIGNELKEAIKRDSGLNLVSADGDDIDVVLILCGCPRACGNKEEARSRARSYLLIAGESIDQVPVREKDIVATVISRLMSIPRG